MKPPRNIEEVQRLTRCITAPGRFICKSIDKCQPFFHVLQKRVRFECDQEADDAFQSLNAYLARLPKIASPMPREPLLLYLAISKQAISVIFVVEQEKE